MWWFLVLLGLLIALAGLAVIALGISIFVSTFGNTLITTGAVAASGGFVIMAMGLVLRQLERFSQRLEAIIGRSSIASPAPQPEQGASSEPSLAGEPAAPSYPSAPAPRPAAHHREEPVEESRSMPNLPPPVRHPAPVQEEHDFSRESELHLAPDAPSYDSAPRGEEAERDRRPARALELPPLRRASEAKMAPETEDAGEDAENAEDGPYIIKSGIVAGMAYTLYSDGSIQAELPDGIVRFDSLNELRDHVARAQER